MSVMSDAQPAVSAPEMNQTAVTHLPESLSLLADVLPDGILLVDADGRIVIVNARLLTMTGYTESELVGRSVDLLVPKPRRAVHARQRKQFTSRPGVRPMGTELDTVCCRKDGSSFHADIALSTTTLGGARHVLASVRDATQRRAVEQERRETEDRFRLLVEGAVGHTFILLDPEGRVATWNLGAERLTGYTADEVIGQPASLFHIPTDIASGRAAGLLRTAALTGRAEDFGWRVRKDGSRFQASVITTATVDASGHLRGFSEMTRDISAALQARDDLERLHLLEQQERLGRDLHDGVIQSVFAVGMSLQGLLSRTDDPAVADRLTQSVRALDDTITELRKFIFGLGSMLTPDALRRELERLITEAQSCSSIQITGVIDGDALVRIGDHAHDLLLVAREALSNVQRHSQAKRCELSVRFEGNTVVMSITDDGVGFDGSAPTAGLGLRNARSRARDIGADYGVESSSAGTSVHFRLPIGS